MNDLADLYRKLRTASAVDADTLARVAAVRGDVSGQPASSDSAEAAIVALARELEPESQNLVEALRGPTVVPFAARLRARPWIPAALAAGVAAAAVLTLLPERTAIDAPRAPSAPIAETVVPVPAGDTMFSVSFEPDGAVAQTDEAAEGDTVFNGDFDS